MKLLLQDIFKWIKQMSDNIEPDTLEMRENDN